MLGSTADGFLSHTLEKLSSTFGPSEFPTRLIIFVLFNGAPDVISSLSAAGSSNGGMFLAVGALCGGGIFVTGVVSAVVIHSSK